MDNFKMTRREKMGELLLNSTFGTTMLGLICIFLFIVLFGIGYLALGLFLAYMIEKANERKGVKRSGGSGGFGVIFLWPVAVVMMIIEGK